MLVLRAAYRLYTSLTCVAVLGVVGTPAPAASASAEGSCWLRRMLLPAVARPNGVDAIGTPVGEPRGEFAEGLRGCSGSIASGMLGWNADLRVRRPEAPPPVGGGANDMLELGGGARLGAKDGADGSGEGLALDTPGSAA